MQIFHQNSFPWHYFARASLLHPEFSTTQEGLWLIYKQTRCFLSRYQNNNGFSQTFLQRVWRCLAVCDNHYTSGLLAGRSCVSCWWTTSPSLCWSIAAVTLVIFYLCGSLLKTSIELCLWGKKNMGSVLGLSQVWFERSESKWKDCCALTEAEWYHTSIFMALGCTT